jgi:TonB-dependent starch-binding outer membrane protein SusC
MKKICRRILLSQLKLSRQTLLIMKVSLLLTFLTTLNVSAVLYSQDAKLNITVKDKSLIEVIRLIEKQSNYRFFFSDNYQDLNNPVSLDVRDKDISEVLSGLLDNKAITYRVLANNIVVITPVDMALQQQTITGMVTDASTGDPLPGVNVLVEGTTIGVITDIDGRYSIDVPSASAILIFSYVGYNNERMVAGDRTSISITLTSDIKKLEEIVVVGYGVQKKSVVTASIAKVTSDDLMNVSPVRIDNSLKGLASGVTVTSSSGQPGAASQVRIRGVGTINDSDPLYIVDGMPIEGGIDYLNPNDIQSIEVLKDAASGAVYGARAANGVILITTKGGSKGKIKLTYNFAKGWASPWRERDVLNGTEYAVMINEGLVNGGNEVRYSDPYSYGKGTNWQKEVFNYDAPQTSHQLSLSGGNEKTVYYISAGYLNQEGIVGGNRKRSNYERLSLRSNATYHILDVRDRNYLNKFTLGLNIGYTRTTSYGITTNSEYGSVLGSAIAFSPLLGIYEEDQEAALTKHPYAVKDPRNGLVYTIAGADYNEITNPLAQLALPGEKGNSDKFVSTFWGEINLWDNLKFKTSFGTDLAFWGNDGWTPKYYLGQSNYSDNSKVWSSMYRSLVWQVENVLSYEKKIKEKHNLQAMIGQSAQKSTGRYLSGSNKYMIEEDGSKANIDFTTGTSSNGDQTVSGSEYSPHTLTSLFARLSYNFDERYMLQGTIRRDGSSNFGANNRFAVFPSVSAGWNITNEPFMSSRPHWLSSMKIRASWGKNGNESIDAFSYAALTSSGNNYTFGSGDGTTYNGTKPSRLANPDLKWEESVQTDMGLDIGLWDNALTITADYYNKKTDGMLMEMSVPSYVGESKPYGNVGDMRNRGVELDASYRFKIAGWNFKIGGNASYVNNKLINLGNADGFSNYDSYQNVGTISRAQNGYPFPFFYGYKTNGIFQNISEINSYVKDGTLIQPDAIPGDVRFVDVNNDGSITDDDRTKIGKGMPDWTYGMNLNVGWKGFDVSIMLQGTVGNNIYDATRRTDIAYINLPSYMLKRWTGEGTSNKIPRFSFSDDNGNWLSSDLFVKDGTFMRVKNVILGYTLPSKWTKKVFISSLRMYVAAENLFTFTRYEGFDPEISSGGTSLGIDRGVYPQARTFSFGINLSI